MNALETMLRTVAGSLRDRNLPWALVGGLAVSVRTEPRFTRDIDVAVAVEDDQGAERLVFDLSASGFRALATVEQDQTHRLATARLAPTGETGTGLMLDILFASSGIEAEICRAAEPVEVFPGTLVPVASLPHLVALKILSRDDRTRPQDAADLRRLIETADEDDFNHALDACRLIEERQFNRTRDLARALTEAWGVFRPRVD